MVFGSRRRGGGSQITPSLKKEMDGVTVSETETPTGKCRSIDRLFLLTPASSSASATATARRLFCFIFALHFRKAEKLSFVK